MLIGKVLSVSLWNNLGVPVFDGAGLAGFNSRDNAFLLAYSCSLPFCLLLFSLSLLSFSGLILWGWSLRTDIVLPTFLYSYNNKDYSILIGIRDTLCLYII